MVCYNIMGGKMNSDKIVYLLKIQRERDHQEKLVEQGLLYMNCAKYYRDLYNINKKQGDKFENALWKSSGGIAMYAPMFCLYAVFEQDLKRGKIILPINLLKDFCENKVYVTVLKYPEFRNRILKYAKENNIGVCSGLVTYGRPSSSFIRGNYKVGKLFNFAFIKSKDYERQKEYRLIFDDVCPLEYSEENVDGMNVQILKNVKANENHSIGNIGDISKCFEFDISNCVNDIELTVE